MSECPPLEFKEECVHCVETVTHSSLREDDDPCCLSHTSITQHFLACPLHLGHGQEHRQVPMPARALLTLSLCWDPCHGLFLTETGAGA